MLRLERMSKFLGELSLGAKVLVIIIPVIGLLSGAAVTGKSMISVPTQLARHDSTERDAQSAQLRILQQMATTDERQLCIAVADHRKQDWTLCYTNPQAVLPDGTFNGNH